MKALLLDEAHKSRYSIHPGATKMYNDLKQNYWWPGMKRDVVRYVEKCLKCRMVKVKHQRSHGMFQSIFSRSGIGYVQFRVSRKVKLTHFDLSRNSNLAIWFY